MNSTDKNLPPAKLSASYEMRDGYIYTKVTGELDQSSAQRVFFEWVEKVRDLPIVRILCDIRSMTALDPEQMPVVSRYNIGKFIAESIPRHFKLAILETPQQRIVGHFGENVMANRGIKVKVTDDLDEALEWLGVTSSDSFDGANN